MPGNLLCARDMGEDKDSCTRSFYILVGGWIINKNRTSAVRKIRQVKGEGVPGGGWCVAVLCRWTGWSSLVG